MGWEPRYTKIQKHRLAKLVGKRLMERYVGRIENCGVIKQIEAIDSDCYVVRFEGTDKACTLHGGIMRDLVRKGQTSPIYTYDDNGKKVHVKLWIEEVMP